MTVNAKTIDGYRRDGEQRNRLMAAYVQCSPSEQWLIQVLAVFYEPVMRSTLVGCLNALGLHNNQGNAFTLTDLNRDLEPLLSKQLLVTEHHQGPRCHPLLREAVLWDTLPERFASIVRVIEEYRPPYIPWGKKQPVYQSRSELIRDVRIAFYQHDFEKMRQCEQRYHRGNRRHENISIEAIVCDICSNPWDAGLIEDLDNPALQALSLRAVFESALMRGQPTDEAFALLCRLCEAHLDAAVIPNRLDLITLYLEQTLLRGYLSKAKTAIILGQCSDTPEPFGVFEGWLCLLEGKVEDALRLYPVALNAELKSRKKRKGFFRGLCGSGFILALLKEGSATSVQTALRFTQALNDADEPHPFRSVFAPLHTWASLQQGDLSAKKTLLSTLKNGYPFASHPLGRLFHALCLYWVQPGAKKTLLNALEPLYATVTAAGYDWLAMETAALLGQLKPKSDYATQAKLLREDIPLPPLVALMPTQTPWQLQLQALRNLYPPDVDDSEEPRATDRRLTWWLTYHTPVTWTIQPREQKLNAKGQWSKGRNVALKRLKQEPDDFDYLTAQDLAVCGCIGRDSYRRRGAEQFTFYPSALRELVGHPLVFGEDSGLPLEILNGEPEVRVLRHDNQTLTLEFFPRPQEKQNLTAIQTSPTQLTLIQLTAEHRRIAEIIGSSLDVPASAMDEVLASVQAIAHVVTIQSEIRGSADSLDSVVSVAKPHFHLVPAAEGLKVTLLCRPFGEVGPYYRPGTGGSLVMAEVAGVRQQTARDLAAETQQAETAVSACPMLGLYDVHDAQSGEWWLDAPEDCLELLLALQSLGDQVIVAWPEGEKWRIHRQVSLEALHLTLRRQKDWFAASGAIHVADERVMEMTELLNRLAQSPGRFVPLGEGQFLALTRTFRQRLDELQAYSEATSKGVRFHPLAALALEALLEGAGSVKADQHWTNHRNQLKAAQTLESELPSTLQADLRDYQRQGFDWLARLAHWGVGACLADDMGLGKTLQALAVILTRAPAGPTLVVAPTSVGANWSNEAQTFAPTLNPILLGSVPSQARQATLDALQPFDLVLCSYGLLQQPDVSTLLSTIEWQIIVLDEAQAIKNSATQRSKAAMKLQGGFKLIMTGTPIENHLGELWNQFRFINPGLLGSKQQFSQRFALPIERQQNKAVRQQLQQLIQPFILRRTKNQVLSELPSRTEITLTVELSAEEKALYEALRREAMATLAAHDGQAGPKPLQILAEIMRLRRLCCHPQLVIPDTSVSSSKLQVFAEVLQELLANRHKALVFSQFVAHLQLIRDHLEQHQIAHQYLDGSTPTQQRQQCVNAFQAGEGDVFLISLKAGGTGLNLTAADYVIHMDPWWNPAVEDQASDRAHRIGQQRPVTVYRLVTQGTIEEKIVELHRHKRDLADSLLEGSDASGKLSSDDLLRLIQEA